MTHTVSDAEAAIARHPECLETLSKAADLLIEHADPRGEDFAACLGGDLTGEELMRKWPADASAMFVAAWRMLVPVRRCKAHEPKECDACELGEARAEALRLLAECGKVGGHPSLGYLSSSRAGRPDCVAERWVNLTLEGLRGDDAYRSAPIRLALLDAYAAADPDTRRRWADETRALAGGAK